MNEQFPMQNERTEQACKIVRETDDYIERKAKRMKNGDYVGCTRERMKPHILSNICLVQNEGALPSIRKCRHLGKKR